MRVRLKKRCLLPSGCKADLARKAGIITVTPLGVLLQTTCAWSCYPPTADVRSADEQRLL
jgi:hypothetical protein